MPKEDTQGFDGRLLRRIVRYLAPYKWWVLVAFVLTAGASFLGPLRPRLVQEAIDGYIVPGDLEGLQGIILLLVGALVGEGIFSLMQGYLTQWIGQHAIYDLRTKVFRHIQRQPLRFFDRTPVGRLITRTTSDVEALSDVLSAGVVVIMGNLFRIAFILYFMFSLNWVLALVVLAVMPVMAYGVFLFRSKVRVQYRETRKQVARLNSFLQEHISGMHIVQAFNREREEMKRFSGINHEHRAAQIKTIFYFALFWPMVDIVASTALGLVIWFGGLQAMAGTLTIGVLIAFIQFSRQFFEPIRNLSDQYNTLQSAMAGAERIFGLLDEDAALVEKKTPLVLDRVQGRIEFRNVWFSYRQEEGDGEREPDWILRDVSFVVEPGQQVAIVGATGAGKTTIINALLRFYDIRQGGIFIDGIDIRDLRLAELRRRVGLVLQDVFLFSGSIAHNLTLEGSGNYRGGHAARRRACGRRRVHPQTAQRVRTGRARTGRLAFAWTAAAAFFCTRARVRPRISGSGRGYFQRGYRNRTPHRAGAGEVDGGPYVPCGCASPVHYPALRSYPRHAQGPYPRAGRPPGIAGDGRAVPPVV